MVHIIVPFAVETMSPCCTEAISFLMSLLSSKSYEFKIFPEATCQQGHVMPRQLCIQFLVEFNWKLRENEKKKRKIRRKQMKLEKMT